MVETIRGRGAPPALVNLYVEALPDDSLTVALMKGGHEHYGWGHDRHLMANLYDLMVLNTQASGNWRKKAPDLDYWPRPETRADEQPVRKAVTVKDVWARLNKT